jgi:hypothetical protein
MNKLNVRFGDTQSIKLKDTSEVLNLDVSKVARAAMLLGINQLLALASRDLDKAKDLALINELRARQ